MCRIEGVPSLHFYRLEQNRKLLPSEYLFHISLHRQWTIFVATQRCLHARHCRLQFRNAILRGRVHSLQLREFGDIVRQGDLPGSGMHERISNHTTRSLLSPSASLSPRRGESDFLHIWRPDLRGEYFFQFYFTSLEAFQLLAYILLIMIYIFEYIFLIYTYMLLEFGADFSLSFWFKRPNFSQAGWRILEA